MKLLKTVERCLTKTIFWVQRPLSCTKQTHDIEAVVAVVPPNGRVVYAGTAVASLEALPWERDTAGFPIGPQPKPERLKRGSYSFVTNPRFSAPPDDAPTSLLRFAWYPLVEGMLEVK